MKKKRLKPGMVAHAFNPSTWEAEAGANKLGIYRPYYGQPPSAVQTYGQKKGKGKSGQVKYIFYK